MLSGTLTLNRIWATATKGGQALSVYLNGQFLMDALSSVSEQAVKNQSFLPLGLSETVA